MGLLKPFAVSPKQLDPKLSQHSTESPLSPPPDDSSDLDARSDDRELFSCELEPENNVNTVSLVLFQRSEVLYFVHVWRDPEVYDTKEHHIGLYHYSIDLRVDLLFADYARDGLKQKKSHHISVVNKPRRRKTIFPFQRLEDAYQFQEAMLGWAVVIDEAHVLFKFNNENQGVARIQLWRETPDQNSKMASIDELPAVLSPVLMLYSDLWDQPRCVYTLMQEGFRVIPSHRDCQHSKEELALCRTLYIVVLAETPRKFTVYVNAGSDPFDLVPFRNPVCQRLHSAAKLSSDCLRLSFDDPEAKKAFASHLRYVLTTREERISERRMKIDEKVRMHNHYLVQQIQRSGPPGGNILLPSSVPRPTAHLPTSTTAPNVSRISPMGFEESSQNLADDGENVPAGGETLPTIRRRNSTSTMSTMSIPAPPYALFEDAQSSGSHYR